MTANALGANDVGTNPGLRTLAIPFTATDVRDQKRTRQFAGLADRAEG